jgi:serine/threonine-protein kinase RIO1
MTTALEIDEALLDAFIGDGSITDVLYVVRSGKEATVYCCRGAAGELVAAKVYRPLERRNFHNDAVYQVGRDAPMSSRDKRALANKSRHGRDLQYGSWIHAEFEIMRMLYEVGADVPEVFGRSNGAILMEYLGDEDGADAQSGDAAARASGTISAPNYRQRHTVAAQPSRARRLVAVQPPLLGRTHRRDRFSAGARRAD